MKKDISGVTPGTQDNITPDEAPMLSEMECDLINLFRALPASQAQTIIKGLFEYLLLTIR